MCYYIKKPSDHYCRTGNLAWYESYYPEIHNMAKTSEARCKTFYSKYATTNAPQDAGRKSRKERKSRKAIKSKRN